MANHRQSIEDPMRMLGWMIQAVTVAAGFACAVTLLLGLRTVSPVAWFFTVMAALLSIGLSYWGGRLLRERVSNYESHEGLKFSAEFVNQIRVFGVGEDDSQAWPQFDEDQGGGASVARQSGDDSSRHLLHSAQL